MSMDSTSADLSNISLELVIPPGLLQQFHESAASVEQSLEGIRVQVASILPPDFAERMRIGLQSWSDLLDALAPHGWLLPFDYTPRETYEMLQLLERRGLAELEARLLQDFRSRPCEERAGTLLTPADRGSPTEWVAAFASAGRAHDRGEYQLAIPIWLAAIDGLARGFLRANVWKLQSTKEGKGRQALQKLGPSGSIAPPAAKALLSVLRGFGKEGGSPVLNRNAILHGEVPPPDSERGSTQAFRALELLSLLLGLHAARRERQQP
jgi:hypothetical protein